MSHLLRTRSLRDVSVIALLAMAGPAFAQTLPPTTPEGSTTTETTTTSQDGTAVQDAGSGQDVVVTGSRIARPEFETLQPTQVVGAAQIENRGYTNVGQVLSEIPAFGPPGNSGVGAQSSFGPAQTFVDFSVSARSVRWCWSMAAASCRRIPPASSAPCRPVRRST
ncbi:hypothetical protein [Sphingomonas paucimobilis]|uniref:hypothetical protein n=1 Tax=Sphingomonas paucimobilis TaxID=13689 RepID=UPI001F0525C9|nr:hypothetical protein [Sphingomonas paucimobilis]